MSRGDHLPSPKSLSPEQRIDKLVYNNRFVNKLVGGNPDDLQEIALEVIRHPKWPDDFDPDDDMGLVVHMTNQFLARHYRREKSRPRQICDSELVARHLDQKSREPSYQSERQDLIRVFLDDLDLAVKRIRARQLRIDIEAMIDQLCNRSFVAPQKSGTCRKQDSKCRKRRSRAKLKLRALIRTIIRERPSLKAVFSETLSREKLISGQRANLTESTRHEHTQKQPDQKGSQKPSQES